MKKDLHTIRPSFASSPIVMSRLLPWWRRPAPSVLGLDLQSSEIRLVELSRSKAGQFQLETCASMPCPPGWLVQGQVHAFDELAQGLRTLVQQCGAHSRDVVLGLPASCVMTRKIHVHPEATESDIYRAVHAAVAQWAPEDHADLIVDHCRGHVVTPSEQEVWVAVSRRDPVQDRVGLAEAAGLHALAVDLEAQASSLAVMALAQTWPHWQDTSTLALIEVETEGAHFQCLQAGELLRDANFTFPRQARPSKVDTAQDGDRIQSLLHWVRAQLSSSSFNDSAAQPQAVVLAGSTPWLPELASSLAGQCQVRVVQADPFELTLRGQVAQSPVTGASAAGFLRAFGLAINGTLH